MGGSGGGYFPRATADLERLIQESKKKADRERLDSDVNQVLRDILATFERDPQQLQAHMEEIQNVLKDEADMEQFLFGGSVAKHTFVDGLSDIDALVILKREDLVGKSPKAVLNAFETSLRDNLLADTVKSIEKGTLAVTLIFRDGMKIQLLPALRSAGKVIIPDAQAKGWKETNPRLFKQSLTRANERLNSALIPAIKLIKSINYSFPKQKQLEGYHIEALAIDAVKGYRGAATVKSLLVHIMEAASKRVLHPLRDVTGQSRFLDSYLGGVNSAERRAISEALSSIVNKLSTASSVDQWKTVVLG